MGSTAQLLESEPRDRAHGRQQRPTELVRTGAAPARLRAVTDLRTRVLFPAARRLRRRRWEICSVVALAALTASALGYAVIRQSSGTTTSKSMTSYSLSWPAIARPWLYFRPVECLIAPLAGDPANGAAPALAMSAHPETSSAAEICQLSEAQQGRYPTTPPGKDNPKAVVVLPSNASGMGRFVLEGRPRWTPRS